MKAGRNSMEFYHIFGDNSYVVHINKHPHLGELCRYSGVEGLVYKDEGCWVLLLFLITRSGSLGIQTPDA